jgi:hypothetical protein
MSGTTTKTKIVEYLAGEALHKLRQAQGEAADMRDRHIDLLGNTSDRGIGLDFAVLRDKLDEASKLMELLT